MPGEVAPGRQVERGGLGGGDDVHHGADRGVGDALAEVQRQGDTQHAGAVHDHLPAAGRGVEGMAPASTGRAARRHSSMPSAIRLALRPRAVRRRTVPGEGTQLVPRQ